MRYGCKDMTFTAFRLSKYRHSLDKFKGSYFGGGKENGAALGILKNESCAIIHNVLYLTSIKIALSFYTNDKNSSWLGRCRKITHVLTKVALDWQILSRITSSIASSLAFVFQLRAPSSDELSVHIRNIAETVKFFSFPPLCCASFEKGVMRSQGR